MVLQWLSFILNLYYLKYFLLVLGYWKYGEACWAIFLCLQLVLSLVTLLLHTVEPVVYAFPYSLPLLVVKLNKKLSPLWKRTEHCLFLVWVLTHKDQESEQQSWWSETMIQVSYWYILGEQGEESQLAPRFAPRLYH